MRKCLNGKPCGKTCIKKTKKCWKSTKINKNKKKKSLNKIKKVSNNKKTIKTIEDIVRLQKQNNDYCITNDDCSIGEQCYNGTCSDYESMHPWKYGLEY